LWGVFEEVNQELTWAFLITSVQQGDWVWRRWRNREKGKDRVKNDKGRNTGRERKEDSS